VSAGHLFRIFCRYCHASVAAASRLGTEEMESMLAHLHACRPKLLDGDTPNIATLLAHFEVLAATSP
jgi:hypothetical protein